MNSKKDLMGKTNYYLLLLFFLIFIVCTTIYYVAAEGSGAPREMVDAVVEEGADSNPLTYDVDIDETVVVYDPLFYAHDRFRDYICITEAIHDWDPYFDWSTNYPPFCLVIAFFFSLGGEWDDITLQTQLEALDREANYPGMIAFVVIYLISILAVVAAFSFSKKNHPLRSILLTLGLTALFICSTPSLFLIDRGNYLSFAIIATMLWALFETIGKKDAAAVMLAFASALKIYPLFILAYYFFEWILDMIREKSIKAREDLRKHIFLCCATGLIVTILPILTFKHSIIDNVRGFGGGLFSFGGGGHMPQYFTVGLTGLISYIAKDLEVPGMLIWFLVGASVALICYILIYLRRDDIRFAEKALVLVALMTWLTPNSYVYNACYMFAPTLALLFERRPEGEKVQKRYFAYIAICALLFVPKAYVYRLATHQSNAIWMDNALMIAIFVIFIATSVTALIRNRNSSSRN